MNKVKLNDLIMQYVFDDPDGFKVTPYLRLESEINEKLDKLPLDTPVPKVKRIINRVFTKYISAILEEEIKRKKGDNNND